MRQFVPDPIFAEAPVTAEEMHGMQWVRPAVVVQIRFVEWTAENRLRHAVFVGVRPDKKAPEVRRERL